MTVENKASQPPLYQDPNFLDKLTKPERSRLRQVIRAAGRSTQPLHPDDITYAALCLLFHLNPGDANTDRLCHLFHLGEQGEPPEEQRQRLRALANNLHEFPQLQVIWDGTLRIPASKWSCPTNGYEGLNGSISSVPTSTNPSQIESKTVPVPVMAETVGQPESNTAESLLDRICAASTRRQRVQEIYRYVELMSRQGLGARAIYTLLEQHGVIVSVDRIRAIRSYYISTGVVRPIVKSKDIEESLIARYWQSVLEVLRREAVRTDSSGGGCYRRVSKELSLDYELVKKIGTHLVNDGMLQHR